MEARRNTVVRRLLASFLLILGAGLRSAAPVALFASLWDVGEHVIRHGVGPGKGCLAASGAWLVSLALCLSALAAWSLLLAAAGSALTIDRGPAEAARESWRRLRESFRVQPDEADRVGRVAGRVALLSCFAALSFLTTSLCTENINKPILALTACVLMSVADLIAAWLLGGLVRIRVRRGLESLGRRRPGRASAFTVARVSASLAIAVAVALLVLDLQWKEWLPNVRAGHLVQLALAFAGHGALTFALLVRPAARWRLAPAIVAALATVLLALALGPVGSNGRVRWIVLTLDGQTPVWADAVRFVTDVDHDGYTSLMGGGDCAPFDGTVSPGRPDVPGNGIDEDCFDGDLRARDLPARPDPHWYDGPDPNARSHNVIVIGGDGIRFDHLPSSGYRRSTMPFLARWMEKRGTVFESAYATTPYTGFSHAALFTGMMPLSFASTKPERDDTIRVPARVTTLPEFFRRRGYETLGVDTMVGRWAPWITRGFDAFRSVESRKAQDVSKAIAALVRKRDQKKPFFLWAFYYDAHAPYVIPAMRRVRSFGSTPADDYDRRLLYLDHELEKLFGKLKPVLDDTIVVFYSDHGESVSATGWEGHGYTLLEEQLHVPLLVSVPGARPHRVRGLVSLVDVFPTLVNLVAGRGMPNAFEGRSLAGSVLSGGGQNGRLVFFEMHRRGDRYGVFDGRYKLVLDLTRNLVSFYDVKTDPQDLRHDPDANPKVALQLERILRRYVSSKRLHLRKRAR
jgi:arylsulfatase A-like enzyme